MKEISFLLTIIVCTGTLSLGAYRFGKPVEAKVKTDILQTSDTAALQDKGVNLKSTSTGIMRSVGNNALIIRGYYKDSFVFTIGWEKNTKKKHQYSEKTELKLPDQTVMITYFDKSCKSDMKNEKMVSALANLLWQIKKQPENTWIADTYPIVINTLYVGTDLKQTAKKYYAKDDINVFAAVLPELDSQLQDQYGKKAYDDDRIDYFSVTTDFLSKERLIEYAKKAYQEDKIDFFSVLSDELSKEDLKKYAMKAYRDDRIDFFAVLSNELSKEDLVEYAKKAFLDKKIDFISMLSNK
jgi:hypothetical protein